MRLPGSLGCPLLRIPQTDGLKRLTAVRLKVEQNQLVGVVGETGVVFDALKGA